MTLGVGFALALLGIWSFLFVRALIGYRDTFRPEPTGSQSVRGVAAYVPARNEVEVVGACLQSLLRNSGLDKIVALDDGSDDGTQDILQDLVKKNAERLLVLNPPAPSEGACGKPSALDFGVKTAPHDGEWLLFVDADVSVADGAVCALVKLATDQKWDLVSAIPFQDLQSPLEKIVMPTIGALLLGAHPPERVRDPDDPLVFANGQLLLVRRSVYEAVGGHHAVRHDVLEDVALARRVKGAGHTVDLPDGRRLARTRMYKSGQELTEGWTKNLWLLLGRRSFVWARLALFAGSAGYIAAAVGGFPVGCLVFIAITSMQAWLRKLGRAHPLWAWAAPLGAVIAIGLLWQSRRRHQKGDVMWKGRRYAGASGESARSGHGDNLDR